MCIVEGREERLECARFFYVNSGDLVFTFLTVGESDSDAAGDECATDS